MRCGPSGGARKSSAKRGRGHAAAPPGRTWDNAFRESRIVTRRYQILMFAMLGLLALPARAADWLPADDVLEKIDAALEPAFDKDVAEARAEADQEDPQAQASPEAQPSEEGTESEGPAREPRTAGRRRLERLV